MLVYRPSHIFSSAIRIDQDCSDIIKVQDSLIVEPISEPKQPSSLKTDPKKVSISKSAKYSKFLTKKVPISIPKPKNSPNYKLINDREHKNLSPDANQDDKLAKTDYISILDEHLDNFIDFASRQSFGAEGDDNFVANTDTKIKIFDISSDDKIDQPMLNYIDKR